MDKRLDIHGLHFLSAHGVRCSTLTLSYVAPYLTHHHLEFHASQRRRPSSQQTLCSEGPRAHGHVHTRAGRRLQAGSQQLPWQAEFPAKLVKDLEMVFISLLVLEF
jgi:hypothetical protein